MYGESMSDRRPTMCVCGARTTQQIPSTPISKALSYCHYVMRQTMASNYAPYYAPNKDFAKQRFFCNFAEKESIINLTALKRIKITVKRITEYRDLMAEYENPISHACDMHLGQCFIVENCTKPEGMCQSAWETLLPFIQELSAGGGNFFDGWMKNPHAAMLSCNDGFRPVSFLVEAIE